MSEEKEKNSVQGWPSSFKEWLESLKFADQTQVSKYIKGFEDQEYQVDSIPDLTEDDLKKAGITKGGPQRVIMKSVESIRRRVQKDKGDAKESKDLELPFVNLELPFVNREAQVLNVVESLLLSISNRMGRFHVPFANAIYGAGKSYLGKHVLPQWKAFRTNCPENIKDHMQRLEDTYLGYCSKLAQLSTLEIDFRQMSREELSTIGWLKDKLENKDPSFIILEEFDCGVRRYSEETKIKENIQALRSNITKIYYNKERPVSLSTLCRLVPYYLFLEDIIFPIIIPAKHVVYITARSIVASFLGKGLLAQVDSKLASSFQVDPVVLGPISQKYIGQIRQGLPRLNIAKDVEAFFDQQVWLESGGNGRQICAIFDHLSKNLLTEQDISESLARAYRFLKSSYANDLLPSLEDEYSDLFINLVIASRAGFSVGMRTQLPCGFTVGDALSLLPISYSMIDDTESLKLSVSNFQLRYIGEQNEARVNILSKLVGPLDLVAVDTGKLLENLFVWSWRIRFVAKSLHGEITLGDLHPFLEKTSLKDEKVGLVRFIYSPKLTKNHSGDWKNVSSIEQIESILTAPYEFFSFIEAKKKLLGDPKTLYFFKPRDKSHGGDAYWYYSSVYVVWQTKNIKAALTAGIIAKELKAVQDVFVGSKSSIILVFCCTSINDTKFRSKDKEFVILESGKIEGILFPSNYKLIILLKAGLVSLFGEDYFTLTNSTSTISDARMLKPLTLYDSHFTEKRDGFDFPLTPAKRKGDGSTS